MRVLLPVDVIGAGTTPSEHQYRFREQIFCERIAKDMAVEDGILQHYINKYRLEHWVSTANDLVKQTLHRKLAAEAEHKKELEVAVAQI